MSQYGTGLDNISFHSMAALAIGNQWRIPVHTQQTSEELTIDPRAKAIREKRLTSEKY